MTTSAGWSHSTPLLASTQRFEAARRANQPGSAGPLQGNETKERLRPIPLFDGQVTRFHDYQRQLLPPDVITLWNRIQPDPSHDRTARLYSRREGGAWRFQGHADPR